MLSKKPGQAVAALAVLMIGAAAVAWTSGATDSLVLRLPGQDVPGDAIANARAEENGLTLAVISVRADGIQTVIEVEVRGREDLGNAAFPTDPQLTAGGAAVRFDGGSSDPANPRRHTLLFAPLSDAGVELTLSARSIGVANQSMVKQVVDGVWAVKFRAPAHASDVRQATGAWGASFGKGSLTVDEVLDAGTGIVFRGHLAGFSFDEIPSFRLDPVLVTSKGEVAPIAIRGGFGEQRERFEFRFPAISEPPVLRVKPRLATPASDAVAPIGPDTVVELSVPRP